MKKVISALDKHFEKAVMCTFLAAIVLTMTLQLAMRYIFKTALPWPEEFCRYCFVFSAMYAIPFSIRNRNMLKVDFIVGFFNGKTKKLLFLAADVMALCLWIFLWIASFKVAKASFHPIVYSNSMKFFPLTIIYCMPVFTLLLAIIRQVQVIILQLRDFNISDN